MSLTWSISLEPEILFAHGDFCCFFFLVGLYDHCGFGHMKLVHGRWYKNCVIFKLFCLIKTFFMLTC